MSCLFVAGCAAILGCSPLQLEQTPMPHSVHAHSCLNLSGDSVDFADHQGQILLIVNVASACGLTPQYTALEEIHQRFKDRGFSVIAFPCNDFGGQEPGDANEIAAMCRGRYATTFPVMEKISVLPGESQSPLYAELIEATGEVPTWNFSKYLIDDEGVPVEFISPTTPPDDPTVIGRIEAMLQGRN